MSSDSLPEISTTIVDETAGPRVVGTLETVVDGAVVILAWQG